MYPHWQAWMLFCRLSNADWEFIDVTEGKYTKKKRMGIRTPAIAALLEIHNVKNRSRMADMIRTIEAGVLTSKT